MVHYLVHLTLCLSSEAALVAALVCRFGGLVSGRIDTKAAHQSGPLKRLCAILVVSSRQISQATTPQGILFLNRNTP